MIVRATAAFRGALLLTLVALALPAQGAGRASATLTVCPQGPPQCQFTTIEEALAAAADGDRILIAPGTYAGGLAITKSVRLIGAGANETTISGNNGQRRPVVTVSPPSLIRTGSDLEVTISGVTITSGFGGIRNDAKLTLNDSVVSRNGDGIFGDGGIQNSGTLTVDRSTIENNYGEDTGGLWNDGTAEISRSAITGNSTDHGGGGIGNAGRLELTRSAVDRNSGNDGAGGGIHNEGTTIVTDATVNGNTARDGGGLYNEEGVLRMRGTAVNDNVTTGDPDGGSGGGILNDVDGTITLVHSSIRRNRALTSYLGCCLPSGGGLANRGHAALVHVRITANVAQAQGGGIANEGVLMLAHSAVTRNTALDVGGTGIFGGGIYNGSLGLLTLVHATVRRNTPDDCYGC